MLIKVIAFWNLHIVECNNLSQPDFVMQSLLHSPVKMQLWF